MPLCFSSKYEPPKPICSIPQACGLLVIVRLGHPTCDLADGRRRYGHEIRRILDHFSDSQTEKADRPDE